MKNLVFFLVILAITSCDQSTQFESDKLKEEESKKPNTDSVSYAAVLNERKRVELTSQMNDLLPQIREINNNINYLKNEIEVQKDRLENIKLPKFLRSQEKREEEIRNQLLMIDELNSNYNSELINLKLLIQNFNSFRKKLKLPQINDDDLSFFLSNNVTEFNENIAMDTSASFR
jgi:predicted RNase H-like nuclease (RuvC/YqgF family)